MTPARPPPAAHTHTHTHTHTVGRRLSDYLGRGSGEKMAILAQTLTELLMLAGTPSTLAEHGAARAVSIERRLARWDAEVRERREMR